MASDGAPGFRARADNDRARQEIGAGPIDVSIDGAAVILTPDGAPGQRIAFDKIRRIRFGLGWEEGWFHSIPVPEVMVWTEGDNRPLVVGGIDKWKDSGCGRFVRTAYARITEANPRAIIETGSSTSLWLLLMPGVLLVGTLLYYRAPVWASIAVGAACASAAYVIRNRMFPRVVITPVDLERAMPRGQ